MRNTHRRHLFLVLVSGLLLLAPADSRAGGEGAVLGRYWLPKRVGQIELYRTGDRFHGKVISYEIPGQLDEQNPKPEFRFRAFVGIDMFEGFRFDPETQRWIDGTIYDGGNGKTYDCLLWFEDDDKSVLFARGFIGVSFLGRTERFERVDRALQ